MITLQERVHGVSMPANWKLAKLHRVLRVRKGHKNIGMPEDNLLSLSYGRIVQKDIDSADGLLPESFETYQIVEPGNIVMRLTDLQNDKRSLRQGLVRERGIVTSAYDALEVSEGNSPRYWAYALLALDLAKYYYSLGGGVRQSIKFSDFPNDWIAVPALATQEAISDFLDRETVRIDQLIEKKNKLINLLDLQAKAQTSRLLENATASASHQSLRWLVRVRSGDFISNLEIEKQKSEASPIPVVGGNGVMAYGKVANSPENTIVVGRVGALCGNVHYIRAASWITDNALIVRLISGSIIPEFLVALLRSANLNDKANKSAQPLITGENIKSMKVHIPDHDVQTKLCREINIINQKKQRLSDAICSSIEKLRDLRAAVITSAVTGQISVETRRLQGRADAQLDGVVEAMRA